MSIRLRIVTAGFLAGIIGIGTGISAPGPASASVSPTAALVAKVTVCLKNSSSYCADVKNSHNHIGEFVYLYKSSQARDYHWYRSPVQCPGQPPGSTNCVTFQDTQSADLCMGEDGRQNIVLMRCSDGEAAWILTGHHHLRNISWGPQGNLTVAKPANTQQLLGFYLGYGWQQWTGL
jgi:hypothetical protein